MSNYQEVVIVATPRRAWLQHNKLSLELSLVFSPGWRSDSDNPEKISTAEFHDEGKKEYELIRRWTAASGLPAKVAEKLEIKVTAGWVTPAGAGAAHAVAHDSTRLNSLWIDDAPYTAARADRAEMLWDTIFRSCWLQPGPSEDKTKIESVNRPSDLRTKGNLIEGISSTELNRAVLCGLAGEILQPKEKIVPASAENRWDKALRQINFAIERQSQLGSAGGVSQTLRQDLERARTVGDTKEKDDTLQRKLGEEYHHRLAMLDDYPDLGRLLGLVVDVSLEYTPSEPELANLNTGNEIQLTLHPQAKAGAIAGVIARGTACVLKKNTSVSEQDRQPCYFYAGIKKADPSKGSPPASPFVAETGCVASTHLRTAQWDLDGSIRSVLRRHGFQQGTGGVDAGANVPAGYGLAVFWNSDTKEVLNSTKEFHQHAGARFASDKLLYADDLVVGYVPAVRMDSSKQWFSLTGRALTLEPSVLAANIPKLRWNDEMALAIGNPEGPQPLAGWVVDILGHQALPSGTPIQPQKRQEEWIYLVSTPSGFVVVKELLDVDYPAASLPVVIRERKSPSFIAAEEEQNGALFDLLPAGLRPSALLKDLGQFAEFRGEWERDENNKFTGTFRSRDSAVRFGQGIAGRLAGKPKFPSQELQGKHSTWISLPIARRRVANKVEDALPGVQDPSPTAEGVPTFAYLRALLNEKLDPTVFDGWPSLYFQGRGARAFTITESEDEVKTANEGLPKIRLRDRAEFRFEEAEGDILVFRWEDKSGDQNVGEKAIKVRLKRKAGSRVDQLFLREGKEQPLTPGSVYQVRAEVVLEKPKTGETRPETTIQAAYIVEVASDVEAAFYEFRVKEDEFSAVFKRSGLSDLICLVDPEETRVTLAADTPTSSATENASAKPPPSVGSVTGSWLELGVRIGRGDLCRLQVLPIEGGGLFQYKLTSVAVAWQNSENLYYCRRVDDEKGNATERAFAIERLDGGAKSVLQLHDKTTILSVPNTLPPRAPWRQWQIPPEKHILRVFTPEGEGGPQRIEIVNVVEAPIISLEEEGASLTATVPLPGAPKGVNLRVSAPLASQLKGWKNAATEIVKKEGSDEIETPKVTANQLLPRLGPATIRLDNKGEVEQLTFHLSGQPALSSARPNDLNPSLYWNFHTLKLRLPIAGPSPDALHLVTGLELTIEAAGFTARFRTETEHPSLLTLQIHDVVPSSEKNMQDADLAVQRQAKAFVLTADEGSKELIGTVLPLFLETPGPGRQQRYFDLLRAANTSGFPLEMEVQPAIVIDDALADSAQWDLLQLPLDLAAKHKAYPVCAFRSKEVAMWARDVSMVATSSISLKEKNIWAPATFSLVTKMPGPGTSGEVPLYPGRTLQIEAQAEPAIPKNDQILANDLLLHYHGWSLAVDPWNKAEQQAQCSPALKQAPATLPVKARLFHGDKPAPAERLPALRVGRTYEICMRTMDIAGNVLSLKELSSGIAAEEGSPVTQKENPFLRSIVHFHPFGDPTDSSGAKFLRFDPVAPPVIWQSSPKPGWTETKPGAGKDAPVLPTAAFVAEIILKTDRRAKRFPGSVRLKALPPPAHWRLAELLGGFDRHQDAETHERIVNARDWTEAKNDAFDAKHPAPKDLWTDSVIDPGVEQLLVLTHEEAKNIRLPLKGKRAVELVFRAAQKDEPVPQNRKRGDELVPKAIPKLGAPELVFEPDVDTEVRIYGIPNLDPNNAVEAMLHFPGLFAKAAAAGLVSSFQELLKSESNPSPNLQARDFESWINDLRELALEIGAGDAEEKARKKKELEVRLLTHPWMATPRTVRVRNITNKPYLPPRLIFLEMANRILGQRYADFTARFDVHRPSTGSLSLQAALEQEYTDDPRAALPSVPDEELIRILEHPRLREEARLRLFALERDLTQSGAAKPGQAQLLGRSRDLTVLLGRPPLDVTRILPKTNQHLPNYGTDEVELTFSQDFHDTRHRTVYYRGVAHTRHGREFFGEANIETNPETLQQTEKSNEWSLVEIPATARPADVNVTDITVLFEWSGGIGRQATQWQAGPGGVWHFTRTRRSGHRIWMERPWYSSGSGEKLAVLLWMDAHVPWSDGQEYARLVSRWGVDPIFEVTLPIDKDRPIGALSRADFISPWAAPLGLKSQAMRPTNTVKTEERNPAESGGTPQPGEAHLVNEEGRMLPVGLAVYQPKFHPERKLWYADLFIEPKCYTPFVSYTVARYQPCSLVDCALSNPRRLRMLQVLPVRTLTVRARNTGVIEIEVELSGIFPDQRRRQIIIQVERNPYLEESDVPAPNETQETIRPDQVDLGWEPCPILTGQSGQEKLREIIEDPEPGEHRVRATVRLGAIPWHRSHWADRIGMLPPVEESSAITGWACRYLRLSVFEDEIFPCAHGMLENQEEAPRRIYSEQVMLPPDLLKGARAAQPDVVRASAPEMVAPRLSATSARSASVQQQRRTVSHARRAR